MPLTVSWPRLLREPPALVAMPKRRPGKREGRHRGGERVLSAERADNGIRNGPHGEIGGGAGWIHGAQKHGAFLGLAIRSRLASSGWVRWGVGAMRGLPPSGRHWPPRTLQAPQTSIPWTRVLVPGCTCKRRGSHVYCGLTGDLLC